MHGFDALTPVEEVIKTLDTLVQTAKSPHRLLNFSGWHPDEIALC